MLEILTKLVPACLAGKRMGVPHEGGGHWAWRVLLVRQWAGKGRRNFPNSEIGLLFNTHSGWGPRTHLQSQMPIVILLSSLWNKWQLLICFPHSSVVKHLPVKQKMKVWSQGWEDTWVFFPGEGDGSPLQCSCLGNLTDRGTWQAKVNGVAKELDMT